MRLLLIGLHRKDGDYETIRKSGNRVCRVSGYALADIRRLCVYVGEGPERASMIAKWNDDEAISGFIHELNYGKYAKAERMIQNERIIGKAT